MSSAIRILGIDPGLRHTGWGIIMVEGSRLRRVADGCISAKTDLPLSERLMVIHAGLEAVIAERKITEERFMIAVRSGDRRTKEDPVYQKLLAEGEIVE